MKISYRTHPGLELLSNEWKVWIDDKDKDQFMSFQSLFIEKTTDLIKVIDKTNILKPSLAFQKAAWEVCKRQIFEKEQDISDDLDGESGVLLLSDRVVYFDIKSTPKKNISIQHITLLNDKNMVSDFCF